MRNLLIISLSFLSTITLYSGNAIVCGKIKNAPSQMAFLGRSKSVISRDLTKEGSVIDKNGFFKYKVQLDKIEKAFLIVADQQTAFYIQPNDSIFVTIDYVDFDKSIVYSGQNSEKNNFLKAYNDKFYFGHEQDIYAANKKRSGLKFAAYCDSLYLQNIAFLKNYPHPLDTTFAHTFTATLKYEYSKDKLFYPGLWSWMNQKGDTMPDMPATYYRFLRDVPLNNEAHLSNSEYFEYLRAVFNYYLSEFYQTPRKNFSFQDVEHLASILFNNKKIEDAYKSAFVESQFEFFSFSEADKAYKDYVSKCSDSEYMSEVTEAYNKLLRLSPGRPAPDFKVKDLAGKERQLSEFKGKVVYIDFWASWCGPCIMELPHTKKLYDEFSKQNIVFLYISVDGEQSDWKNAVKKHTVPGINLNTPKFESAMCKAYNIDAIPRQFLIDKNGLIVDNNLPPASSYEQVKKILTKAIEK